MITFVTQGAPLDRFANDFLEYACWQFRVSNRWLVKVVQCDERNWIATIPAKMREKLDERYEEQKAPIALVYGLADEAKVSRAYRRICLQATGFTQEQIDSLSQFDVLFFVRTDLTIPNHKDLPFPALLVLSHMTIHFAEMILHRKIIQEPHLTHNYDDKAAVHLLRMFVEELHGLENFLKLYRY